MNRALYLLGIDIGSSSVKAVIVDIESGSCVASAFSPETEMRISAPKPGWAEQHPLDWESHAKSAIGKALQKAGLGSSGIGAIGITYQMHGLICLDKNGIVLRPSIIWCDSRAVETGNKAFDELGREFCFRHYLNSPGNFTASKLRWVKENEPEIFEKTKTILLPGDWLAFRLTGEKCTTRSGLSEGILWDYERREPAVDLLNYYGIPAGMIPPVCETFGIQGRLTKEAAASFNLEEGIPVSYRSGDQPNNAFSLRALNPGDIAATAGTSGVVYCVTGKPAYDKQSRVNTFVHVNDSAQSPRNGVLLCINGTGISNSWIRNTLAGIHSGTMLDNSIWQENAPMLSYIEINAASAKIPAGSDGLMFIPFGNGAERMLNNAGIHASFENIDFTRHSQNHLFRAVQEGIAFAFRYGLDIMAGMGFKPAIIRAGHGNMFLSPVFTQTLANLTSVTIELYNTNGAIGAALGAGMGAGIYSSADEAFGNLKCIQRISPDSYQEMITNNYHQWEKLIHRQLQK